MIKYPEKPWVDKQTFTHTTQAGDEIAGIYDAPTNTWSFYKGNADTVFTSTVYTVDIKPAEQSIAAAAALFDDSLPVPQVENLVTQQDVNWYLYGLISGVEGSSQVWIDSEEPPKSDAGEPLFFFWYKTDEEEMYVWDLLKEEWKLTGLMDFDRPPIISGGAPTEHPDFPGKPLETGDFWFDTTTLEVLINYNGQWFPVSIPPTQVQVLREVIEGLEVSVTQVRGDIALNKIDIDELGVDLREERDAIKEEIDGKLATLEEELEQLAPSLERGSWTFTLNHPPGPGEYTMLSAFLDEDDQEALCNQTYADCLAAAGNDPLAQQACTREWDTCKNAIDGSRVVTTDDWTQCEELIFNDVDMNGTTHAWGGIDSDHYIDVFNMNDENYMVGDIATHGGGTFSFDLVSSKGVASGPATIKIFKTEGTVDFDQYVRKAGDTMKGRLTINPDAATPPLYIYNHEDVTANTYSIRQFGVPYTDEEGVTQRDTVFYTTAGGDISGGVDWKPTRNQHLANVKYVHDQVNKLYYPARFSWIVKTETSAGPVSGQIQWNKTSMSDSTEVRVHFKSYDGKLDLFDVADEKVVYDGPSNSSMMITGYYIGSDTNQKWKWKGTANITKITVYKRSGDCYFKCNLGSYKTSNATFNDGGRYYFTIPGLF